MSKFVPTAALALSLIGCQKSDTKILIGATTITGTGAAPIPLSVIVVAGKTIRAVGTQKDVPIPQDSERSDLAGKWIVPEPGGRIAAGEPASFLVLDRAPINPELPGAATRKMTDGVWQEAR
jgi:hypothetical protein